MKKIFYFILGGIVFGTVGVLGATYLYNAKEVSYNDTNVESAINDLYDLSNNKTTMNGLSILLSSGSGGCDSCGSYYGGNFINSLSLGKKYYYYITGCPAPIKGSFTYNGPTNYVLSDVSCVSNFTVSISDSSIRGVSYVGNWRNFYITVFDGELNI